MGLWSWLRGVSEPDTGGTSAPGLPSGGEPSGRDAAAPPSDPGWRALPPVQRTLADGVHSVARLGDFAGSLATWQSPRMLTELEHGRGPSAPSGSAVGIVDATPGPPGVAELPVAGVPLSPLTTPSLPGSATAPVQREVRFDPPGRTALQTGAVGGRRVGFRRAACRSAARRADRRAAVGRIVDVVGCARPAAGGARPHCRLRRRVSGRRPWGCRRPARRHPARLHPARPGRHRPDRRPVIPPWATPVPRHPTRWRRPSTVRRSPNAPSRTRIPAGPVLGATPLPRTLAEPPTMLQRSVDAPGRPLSQLPVLADATPVRSFVTAPPPPTARPALPVVPVGDGVVQRAVGSMTDRPTSTGAGSSVADGAAPVTTSGDAHAARPGRHPGRYDCFGRRGGAHRVVPVRDAEPAGRPGACTAPRRRARARGSRRGHLRDRR